MNKSFLKGVISGFLAACIIAGAVYGTVAFVNHLNDTGKKMPVDPNRSDIVRSEDFLKKYDIIHKYIDEYYMDADSVKDEDIANGMFQGYLSSIGDKYADYYDSEEYDSFLEKTNGQYGGIGIYVSQDEETGGFIAVKVMENEPADEAGIEDEDIILEIDGKSISGMDLSEVSSMIKGEEGTQVIIKISRNSEIHEYTITRKMIDVYSVDYEVIEDGQIGYIYIYPHLN